MAGSLVMPAAFASEASDAKARFQQDRADCLSGRSNQDRATCMKEATAALQESRRGNLRNPAADLERNRVARCNGLPPADRPDCEMRLLQPSATSGSAQQGGILRESTRVVPAR